MFEKIKRDKHRVHVAKMVDPIKNDVCCICYDELCI